MSESRRAAPLEDFPLQGELGLGAPGALPEPERSEAADVSGVAAPLGPRLSAAAADAAAILLLTALAILGARLVTGQSPRPSGIPWALGFLVYLSLFATVPALVLFGRTVGMAISDLSARDGGASGMPAGPAVGRDARHGSDRRTAPAVDAGERRRSDSGRPPLGLPALA